MTFRNSFVFVKNADSLLMTMPIFFPAHIPLVPLRRPYNVKQASLHRPQHLVTFNVDLDVSTAGFTV